MYGMNVSPTLARLKPAREIGLERLCLYSFYDFPLIVFLFFIFFRVNFPRCFRHPCDSKSSYLIRTLECKTCSVTTPYCSLDFPKMTVRNGSCVARDHVTWKGCRLPEVGTLA